MLPAVDHRWRLTVCDTASPRVYNPSILVDRLRVDRFHLWGRRSADERSFRPGHSKDRQSCPPPESEARRTISGHDVHGRHGGSRSLSSPTSLPRYLGGTDVHHYFLSCQAPHSSTACYPGLCSFPHDPLSKSSASTAKAEATGRKASQRPLGASKYVTCHPPWQEIDQLRRHQQDGVSVAQQADLCDDGPGSRFPL